MYMTYCFYEVKFLYKWYNQPQMNRTGHSALNTYRTVMVRDSSIVIWWGILKFLRINAPYSTAQNMCKTSPASGVPTCGARLDYSSASALTFTVTTVCVPVSDVAQCSLHGSLCLTRFAKVTGIPSPRCTRSIASMPCFSGAAYRFSFHFSQSDHDVRCYTAWQCYLVCLMVSTYRYFVKAEINDRDKKRRRNRISADQKVAMIKAVVAEFDPAYPFSITVHLCHAMKRYSGTAVTSVLGRHVRKQASMSIHRFMVKFHHAAAFYYGLYRSAVIGQGLHGGMMLLMTGNVIQIFGRIFCAQKSIRSAVNVGTRQIPSRASILDAQVCWSQWCQHMSAVD